MNARNAGKFIGFHFVIIEWSRIVVHGIVTYARNAGIGESGIAMNVINVLMEYRCPVDIAVNKGND